MRSESDGHCLPTSFPGLAVREARRRGSPRRSLRSARRPVQPDGRGVPRPRRGAARARSGWDESVRRERVERIGVEPDGFSVGGVEVPHVLVATGHPGLQRAGGAARDDPRVVHAYEPHDYARDGDRDRRGARCRDRVAERARRRRDASSRCGAREPVRRPLNVPREWFSRRGARRLPPHCAARSALRSCARCSRRRTRRARAGTSRSRVPAARFRVEPELNGAEQVICATGFLRGFQHDPLLRALVDGARPRDVRRLDRARPGLDGARADRRAPDARTRGRRRRSGRSRRPTRSSARSTRRAACSRGCRCRTR